MSLCRHQASQRQSQAMSAYYTNSRITAQARVFSKMDAKACYWTIHLDEASQEIFPNTFREVLLQEASIWFVCVPIPIPTGHGPNPSKSTRLCRYRGRRSRVRARQRRERLEPVATNAGCQRGRHRIQFQEMRHQDQRGRILRVCVWQRGHQARPEQDRRDTQDVYPTRQGRSATVNRLD